MIPKHMKQYARNMREMARVESKLMLDIFTAPYSEPETSRAAAKAIAPHLGHLEAVVLSALRDHGPQTAQELEERLKMDGSTVRPRLVTLRARGLVKDSGDRRWTRSLRAAKVWQAT